MDVPDLVRQELGGEEIQASVSLGDDDEICFTPTRSLIYRGEGLLSDEGVTAYTHDFDRLTVSKGRRKTRYTLTYVDRTDEFTVPGSQAEPVLERLLEGSLRADGVIDTDESVTGVFRFSELTIIVAQQRLIKHVGEHTWDGDFEVYPFDDVTGLHFEDGNVATAVVLESGGRPERIKAPNEQAGALRRTLQEALFAYYDVGSLDALTRTVAVEDEDGMDEPADSETSSAFGLESGIDPLVSESGDSGSDQSGTSSPAESETSAGRSTATTADRAGAAADTAGSATIDDLAVVTDQLADLTAAVERQTERIDHQQRTVEQLIEELRRGR